MRSIDISLTATFTNHHTTTYDPKGSAVVSTELKHKSETIPKEFPVDKLNEDLLVYNDNC